MLYAIGDIHGNLLVLQKLYQEIISDIELVNDPLGAQIIFLGDYVDRGVDSKGVLDFLMGLNDSDLVKHIILLGNHELLMYDSWLGHDSNMYRIWLSNGGNKTLQSFDIPNLPYMVKQSSVLEPYAKWINTLPFYYTIYNYIFCHSGFIRTDFNIPLDAQKDSLLWGRPHYDMYEDYDKWVIHGHTVVNSPYLEKNRINVDIGCGRRDRLACVVLPHNECTESDIRFICI